MVFEFQVIFFFNDFPHHTGNSAPTLGLYFPQPCSRSVMLCSIEVAGGNRGVALVFLWRLLFPKLFLTVLLNLLSVLV